MPPTCGTVWCDLVDDQQEVLAESSRCSVGGGSPGLRPVEMARVVLDAVAEAHLLHHLEVVHRALLEALRLEQAVLGLQISRAAR